MIPRVSKRSLQVLYQQALMDLKAHYPRCITDVPNRIARSVGPRRILAGSPDNFLMHHIEYLAIEVVIRLLFGNDWGMRGLQLGSKYGPYLHYLKEKRRCPYFLGVDTDPVAVRYARSIGVSVVRASVTDLPFVRGSFDLVFSQNLLADGRALRDVSLVLRPGGIYISSIEEWSGRQVAEAGFRPHPAFEGQWFDKDVTPEFRSLQVFEKVPRK